MDLKKFFIFFILISIFNINNVFSITTYNDINNILNEQLNNINNETYIDIHNNINNINSRFTFISYTNNYYFYGYVRDDNNNVFLDLYTYNKNNISNYNYYDILTYSNSNGCGYFGGESSKLFYINRNLNKLFISDGSCYQIFNLNDGSINYKKFDVIKQDILNNARLISGNNNLNFSSFKFYITSEQELNDRLALVVKFKAHYDSGDAHDFYSTYYIEINKETGDIIRYKQAFALNYRTKYVSTIREFDDDLTYLNDKIFIMIDGYLVNVSSGDSKIIINSLNYNDLSGSSLKSIYNSDINMNINDILRKKITTKNNNIELYYEYIYNNSNPTFANINKLILDENLNIIGSNSNLYNNQFNLFIPSNYKNIPYTIDEYNNINSLYEGNLIKNQNNNLLLQYFFYNESDMTNDTYMSYKYTGYYNINNDKLKFNLQSSILRSYHSDTGGDGNYYNYLIYDIYSYFKLYNQELYLYTQSSGSDIYFTMNQALVFNDIMNIFTPDIDYSIHVSDLDHGNKIEGFNINATDYFKVYNFLNNSIYDNFFINISVINSSSNNSNSDNNNGSGSGSGNNTVSGNNSVSNNNGFTYDNNLLNMHDPVNAIEDVKDFGSNIFGFITNLLIPFTIIFVIIIIGISIISVLF